MSLIESARMYTQASVAKYDLEAIKWVREKTGLLCPEGSDFRRLGVTPHDTADAGQPGNLLVNVGINQLISRLVTGEQVWDQTHTGIAVGDTNTAAAAGNTDLAAASNKRYNQCDTGFPSAAGSQQMIFETTFSPAEANFAWNEYGLIVPDTSSTFVEGTTKPTDYILFNRKVASLGTKTVSESWVFTVTITLS